MCEWKEQDQIRTATKPGLDQNYTGPDQNERDKVGLWARTIGVSSGLTEFNSNKTTAKSRFNWIRPKLKQD